ncbi:MarR family transcriptional regulator [Nocardiopsis sp. NPDC049922]|uniref:MarR family winged helix-turn-helix transcriptional regulator n=1 Tax=Nocardiopsis sp. NPDC049922 TaxID=3155157 RepID=UPI0033D079A0
MAENSSGLDNPLALEHQVCFSLAVASRTVIALYRPVLSPLGLTHPQYLVMLALWQFAPLSVRELADLLELDSATLSPLLKRLESAGLILRERLPEDERRLTVGLTRAGRDLRARAEAIPMHMMEKLGLSLEELQQLNTTLNRLTTMATSALGREEGA